MKDDVKKRRRTTQYYTDGNTVRRMEPMPDYRREREKRIRRERELEQQRRQRAVRRNQERALQASKSSVAFMTMAVLVFAAFCALYIKVQSNITTRMKAIAALESQIADLKADNDEALKRINTSVNLDTVRNAAMTDLEMSYAKESQIIYYTVEDDDYMNQYSEIPAE